MDKELTVLEIKSDDIDMCGVWNRADVEQEMLEIGLMPRRYDNWISYILNHFDISDCIVEAIADDDVYEIKFKHDGENVHVIKH